jgi:hypothetical protein
MARFGIVTAALICLACTCLLPACAPSTVQQEWPVAQLAMPPGAVQAKLPPAVDKEVPHTADGLLKVSSDSWSDGLYYRCFDSPGGWEALVAQVEGGITPLGYKLNQAETDKYQVPHETSGGLIRMYNSPSGQIEVWLFNLAALARFSYDYDGGGDYLLIAEVVKW